MSPLIAPESHSFGKPLLGPAGVLPATLGSATCEALAVFCLTDGGFSTVERAVPGHKPASSVSFYLLVPSGPL